MIASEDGVWTTLRVAPQQLPKGDVEMIPALHYLRLAHVPTKAQKVKAILAESRDDSFGKNLLSYTLDYKDVPRKLEIFFEKEAPHRVQGWRETGRDDTVTTARRTHETMLDYWSKNRPEHRALRQTLGLSQ